MNKAFLNLVEQVFLWSNEVSFGYMPKSDIAGSWVILIPNFLRKCHIDFHNGHLVFTPTGNGGVLLAPHPHSWIITCVIDLSHSDGCKTKFKSCFDLHFPDGYNYWTFLSVSQLLEITELKITCFQLYPIFNWIVRFFWYLVSCVVHTSVRSKEGKISFPILYIASLSDWWCPLQQSFLVSWSPIY